MYGPFSWDGHFGFSTIEINGTKSRLEEKLVCTLLLVFNITFILSIGIQGTLQKWLKHNKGLDTQKLKVDHKPVLVSKSQFFFQMKMFFLEVSACKCITILTTS
jgi:hypothetical protein